MLRLRSGVVIAASRAHDDGHRAPPAAAQSVASAAIRGKVTDETSAALPGVTVTATSASLIGGQAVAMTDATGEYVLPDLPIGQYPCARTRSRGFQRLARQDIILTAGFTCGAQRQSEDWLGRGDHHGRRREPGRRHDVDHAQRQSLGADPDRGAAGHAPSAGHPDDHARHLDAVRRRPRRRHERRRRVHQLRHHRSDHVLMDGVNTRQDATIDQGTGNGPDVGTLEEMQVVDHWRERRAGAARRVPEHDRQVGRQLVPRPLRGAGRQRQFQDDNITPELRAQGIFGRRRVQVERRGLRRPRRPDHPGPPLVLRRAAAIARPTAPRWGS